MKNNTTSINEILVDNYNTVPDAKIIAEFFNEYFVNIGPSVDWHLSRAGSFLMANAYKKQ